MTDFMFPRTSFITCKNVQMLMDSIFLEMIHTKGVAMKTQFYFPKIFTRLLGACSISLFIIGGSTTALAASNQDACALISPADLTVLLGGKVTAKNNAGSCTWTAAGSAKKLIAARIKATGTGAEMAYKGARMNAPGEGKVKVVDEAGLGDKAFAVMPSFGIAMFILKQGHLIELQFWTGTTGTEKDLSLFRPVAKKISAAF